MTFETKKSQPKIGGHLIYQVYPEKCLDMPLNEFSNLISHQSLQGCPGRLSNSANPSRLFMHANYSTCSVPKATLCSSKKPAQIGQSQRGGLFKKELVLPQKWGVVLYSEYRPKPMF